MNDKEIIRLTKNLYKSVPKLKEEINNIDQKLISSTDEIEINKLKFRRKGLELRLKRASNSLKRLPYDQVKIIIENLIQKKPIKQIAIIENKSDATITKNRNKGLLTIGKVLMGIEEVLIWKTFE